MRRRTWLLVALVVVAGAAVWLWQPRRQAPSAPPQLARDAAEPTWAMRWKPDTVYRYRLDYASSQDLKPLAGLGSVGSAGGGEVQSDVSYRGQLHLRALQADDADGGVRLGLRLAACESAAVEVSGQPLLGEAGDCDARLAPHELVVELDARGRPREVREPAGAPEVFGYLAAFLAAELAVTWPPDAATRWQAREIDMLGTADSAYRVVSESDSRLHVERRRTRYTRLDAAALSNAQWDQTVRGLHKLTLHRHGHVEEMAGAQTVGASVGDETFLRATARFRLELLGLGADAARPPALVGYAARPLKQARSSPRQDDRALRDRAGDLTREAALSLLRRFAGGGRVPDHNRFLWQVTALLRLHPDLAQELVPIFLNGNSRARGLILDVLASAGTSQAQAAMRTALASEEVRGDPDRHLLSQRLGMIEQPDAQTVAFARARFVDSAASPELDDRYGAAYTLGAVAGHAGEPVKRELRDLLVDALTRSSAPASVAHLINALANARDPADAPRFAGYAEHADGDVRRAAAAALARPAGVQGRATLVRMVADADRGVQKQAIRSLRHHALTERDLEALADIVARGELHHTNARPLLELTKHSRREHPAESERLLEVLIDAGIRDNKVLAAARRLLRGPPPR